MLCTHRENLEALVSYLALRRTVVPVSGPPMEKAAAWLVRGTAGGANGVELRRLPALQVTAHDAGPF